MPVMLVKIFGQNYVQKMEKINKDQMVCPNPNPQPHAYTYYFRINLQNLIV